jgi:hypothetical protein
MAFPFLIVGAVAAVAFFLATPSKDKKKAELPKAGEPSQQELALMSDFQGMKMYLPQVRAQIVQALKTKQIHSTELPFAWRLVQKDSIVPASQGSAYEGAKTFHAQGLDIWVTPTMLSLPADQERFMMTMSPGQKPTGNIALLVPASDPWPETNGLIVQQAPPPPDAAPPSPSA